MQAQRVQQMATAQRPLAERTGADDPDPEQGDEGAKLAEQEPPQKSNEANPDPRLSPAQPEDEIDERCGHEQHRQQHGDEDEREQLERDPADAPDDARAARAVVLEQRPGGDWQDPHSSILRP